MNYVVSTFFDGDSWNRYGLNWVRTAKSNSLDAIIIGKDLPNSAIEKIKELEYVYVPTPNRFKSDCNNFYALSCSLQKGQRCLWTKPELLPKSGLETGADLLCSYSPVQIDDLMIPVVNLWDRAAMISSLKQNIEKVHGKYLSSDFMLGTSDFWNGLVGCRAYLFEKRYLQEIGQSDDLVLNFFVALTNSLSVEVKEYA